MPRLLLQKAEIERRLGKLRGWRREGKFISKTFEFDTFAEGIHFVDRVAKVADEQDHHPDIRVVYTTVKFSLQTHSEGGVTAWDFDLAKAIDELDIRP